MRESSFMKQSPFNVSIEEIGSRDEFFTKFVVISVLSDKTVYSQNVVEGDKAQNITHTNLRVIDENHVELKEIEEDE